MCASLSSSSSSSSSAALKLSLCVVWNSLVDAAPPPPISAPAASLVGADGRGDLPNPSLLDVRNISIDDERIIGCGSGERCCAAGVKTPARLPMAAYASNASRLTSAALARLSVVRANTSAIAASCLARISSNLASYFASVFINRVRSSRRRFSRSLEISIWRSNFF